MNINNEKTGNVNIPGALHSTASDSYNQIGNVVAYAGDIYDTTLLKNQSQINQEFSESLSSSSAPTYSAGTGISISDDTISVDATQLSYNDLLDKLVRDVNYGEGIIISGLTMLPCDVLDGSNNVAMGAGAIVADGYGAIAAGYITLANGWGACANGAFTYAEGSGTHVEGKGLMDSMAIIRESYTQGNTDIVVNQAFPVGAIILNKDRSAILCYVTNCEEYGNYYKLTLSAGLDRNLSTGKNVQIIGYAKGIGAHAEGCGTIAKGDGTHAEGMYTVTNNNAEHACGKYNKSTPEDRILGSANVSSYGTQFSIGIGSSYTQRANAFEVLGNGDIYVKGLGSYDGTSISNVSTLLNVITGINTRVTTLENSSSSSSPSSSYITYSEGQGYSIGDTTTASGENSFAEGSGTVASAYCSHAEGSATKAIETSSHAEGNGTKASGKSSHAEGNGTTASGKFSHAEGDGTEAIGESSHAEGNRTTASGKFSHAEGTSTSASGYYSHAEGDRTGATKYCSHAEGYQTSAEADYSHAEGEGTRATGTKSHAEGSYTETTNDAEHAEGSYNLSTSNVTKSSIGIGTAEDARKNAVEVTIDGSVYIKGIGNYDGTNIGANGVKSVQQVITELTLQIAALTNNL